MNVKKVAFFVSLVIILFFSIFFQIGHNRFIDGANLILFTSASHESCVHNLAVYSSDSFFNLNVENIAVLCSDRDYVNLSDPSFIWGVV